MTLGTDNTRPLRPALVSVVRLASLSLALVSLVALLFSIATLVQAGPSGIAEIGVRSLGATWPTAAALALILFGPAVWQRLGTAPSAGLALMGAWLVSAALYLSFGGAGWSLRSMLATLIWTLAPLVPAFTVRAIMALRGSARPSTQMLINGAIGLVLWWLAAPTAITITCAVARKCP
jgi:hypothetical protein